MGEPSTAPEDLPPPPKSDSTTATKRQNPLQWSSRIGRPPYLLDPKDLPKQEGGRIERIDEDTIVKYGPHIRLAEAEAMHLVSQKTTIPCPKVEAAYILEGTGYIVMSYEEGRPFNEYWDDASDAKREKLIAQLKDYVSQMREIKGSFIGGVDHSPCRDGVFAWDHQERTQEYGPYENQDALNEGLVQALENCAPPQTGPLDTQSSGYNRWWMIEQLARSFRSKEIVFTHGDLHAGNMLVRDDGTVVILDWGLAGYFPDYWEFHRATFNGAWRHDFVRQIERFVPPFYMEAFAMRQIFDKLVG